MNPAPVVSSLWSAIGVTTIGGQAVALYATPPNPGAFPAFEPPPGWQILFAQSFSSLTSQWWAALVSFGATLADQVAWTPFDATIVTATASLTGYYCGSDPAFAPVAGTQEVFPPAETGGTWFVLTIGPVQNVTPTPTPVPTPVPIPTPTPVPIPTPVPVPTPTPVPVPTPTPITERVATAPLNLGASASPAVISNVVINGGVQNISIQGRPSATLTNVVSANAFASVTLDPFQGQGLYVTACPGGVTLNECAFLNNGRPNPPGGYANTPIMFRHGGYFDVTAGPITATNCIFAGNAADGAQLRPNARHLFTNCVFFDNAIHVEAIMGFVQLVNCWLIGSHYIWNGSAWTSLTAILNYGLLGLQNVIVIGTDGMGGLPNSSQHPGTNANTFPQGAIESGGSWGNTGETFIPPPAGSPLIVPTGVNIMQGWIGHAFAGHSPWNGSGILLSAGPPASIAVTQQIESLVAALITNPGDSVLATITQIQDLLAPLVVTTPGMGTVV